MEALTSELDVQLKLLTFTQGKTTGIVEKANTEGIERHRDALRAIVKRIESVKRRSSKQNWKVAFKLTS